MTRARAFGLVIALMAGSAGADAPNGSYVPFELYPQLVFPAGAGERCDMSVQGEVCFAADVDTDAFGSITGTGTLGLDGEFQGALPVVLSGRLGGSYVKPKASLDLVGGGTLLDGASAIEIAVSGRLKCKPPGFNVPEFLCTAKLRLCPEQGRCRSLRVFAELPMGDTAPEVSLDLATDAQGRVSGSAQIDVNGEVLDFDVTGKYNARADTSKLLLLHDDSKTKVKLTHLTLGGLYPQGKVSHNLGGQKGTTWLPRPPF